MILINPHKEHRLHIPMTIGMRGFLRYRLINKFSGKVRYDTGFFPNKILDNGRNNMSTQATWLTNCHIGTGSVPPTGSDTQLGGFIANTTTITENLTGTQNAAPYFGWRRMTFRYASGAGQGGENISEAGIGWGASGSTLISRALIVDPDTQETTTVTPLTDEILDVTYELRYYPPLIDALNTVTLNGVVYDTITRAALVTGDAWSLDIGKLITEDAVTNSSWQAFDGAIGTILTSPSGTGYNMDDDDNVVAQAYSNNSYKREFIASMGPFGWNVPTGIRSILILTTAGAFQTNFAAQSGGGTIPKDDTFTLALGWTLSWAGLDFFYSWGMIAASDSTTPASGEWNTNVAGTLLRVNWIDNDTDDRKAALTAPTGTVFRIIDESDSTKWVEYTTTGAYSEQASWTQYAVTQTAINNSGPTVGNVCSIKGLNI